jgi:hypothetical protein
MKHQSTRDLYGYWNERRGRQVAPERSDIDPSAIPRVLADTFLLGAEPGGEPIFRLAGTRVCALFCRELKGERFADLFGRRSSAEVRDLVNIVCDETVPTVAGVTAHLADGTSSDLELLMLPLRHRGRTDARLLGVLAPTTIPVWIGAVPIATMTLGTLRHFNSFGEMQRLPPLPSVMRNARVRHGLVVYEGGRTS